MTALEAVPVSVAGHTRPDSLADRIRAVVPDATRAQVLALAELVAAEAQRLATSPRSQQGRQR